MEATIGVCVHDLQQDTSGLPRAVAVTGPNSVNFTCPPALQSVGFPVSERAFTCSAAAANPNAAALQQAFFASTASQFVQQRQNLVAFAYGVRSTPRRQLLLGSGATGGYAAKVLGDAVTGAGGASVCAIACFVLGHTERVVDLTALANEQGIIVESVKEGPRVRGVERVRVRSSADVTSLLGKIAANCEKVFAAVLPEKQPTPELEAFPPFNGDTLMLQLYRYESEEHFAQYSEANSITFVALGDAERPVLCGVDAAQQVAYEKTQRVLLSAAGIISSIKCSRLRIPFGKSKLSQLLRRCYNGEKGNPYNAVNAPTKSVLLIHCFSNGKWAEESFHALSMIHRVSNMLGSTGIGSMLRDLQVEKWRLDQDIAELRDELLIAKKVYDYKPCIYESTKPIPNIEEEEHARIAAIQAKRNEAMEKQLAIIRQRAKEEATRIIKEQEMKSGTTLADLEKTLEAKKKENAALLKERDERTKEYEQMLEKMRRKKEEEESSAEALKGDIAALEGELAHRQQSLQDKQRQLELSRLDRAKGRDAVAHERESVQAVRKTVLESRRRQREQWVKQIQDINEKVRDQVRSLAEERRRNGDAASSKEDAAEKMILDDIDSAEKFIPKLISLEDVPVNAEEIETIRRQFTEVFSKEKAAYTAKIEEERSRKEKLERGLEAYRHRVLEAAQERKKDSYHNAAVKDEHVSALTDKVLTYLQGGLKMTKISSQGNLRRRNYFISDDCKRIHSCELDTRGFPISFKKPPVTVWIKDIKQVVIGLYTPSFVNFSSEAELAKTRAEAMRDDGTFRYGATQCITPSNLGTNNYRAFGLLLKGGKSLELVCDSDADWEGWLLVLKRLLNLKTEVEMRTDRTAVNAINMKDMMRYGGMLDIRNMQGFLSLCPEEAQLCSEDHIPPALYLRMRKEMGEMSQTGLVTVYDVRNASGLDFIRSRWLYDFLVKQNIVSVVA
eukprot:gene2121-1297_t